MENNNRCPWCLSSELYKQYHDTEWGVPVHDDQKMFEFIILETFQAGLSWLTILNKRAHFKKAFDGFDYQIIKNYSETKIAELLQDKGIVRNQLKIRAAVTNAAAFIKIQEEFGSFCQYLWQFVNNQPLINRPKTLSDVPSSTPLSDQISKDLKQRGFKFMGTTVVYAHLQATGIVNDHLESCSFRG
ncbi:DNA-3-methyladenine glycosylase [Flavobacterium branchiophilum NBRC 15030 = ATCC 35035]|uniref:DNA-3-methyladenine glycosylase I n=2 Tax=Flavobacterium branchiophilum TaxID=55197 RepID=G2Z6B8_FLABF|nr:DNA-3-methyladenine glycosylase I [Flavobacterium branchiophilum]OXA79185.1 DNA-3-methyladenine glycosylase [Flavobacterium branchiophilum NBRC 15030 = ATCC 35035]TQM40332.1 DNA-3-methyladenine glycosylase I [Flavobacterium branchiophilum]GEM56541.1 DNA-3-methyladenine glycosylase I [Flavobacterium branchiophilum NBRC 15030 = ATCC 35035]CCB70938.1 DNA-3-methyladenine glycosylase I [Flavobacterium branchiophilum FL-15]